MSTKRTGVLEVTMATTLNRIINHKAAWHLIDAKGQIAGRLAVQIAPILRGKHKPTFCPNDDCGDYVVVVNAKAVEFTGRKWKNKLYRWHSGYPGGLKERPANDQLERKPEEGGDGDASEELTSEEASNEAPDIPGADTPA